MRLPEIRLVRRAIKRRWPMTDKLRRTIIAQLTAVVKDPENQRCLVHAAKAILDADKLNMEQEKRDAGGDTLNVNLNDRRRTPDELAADDALSDDELARRHLAAIADSRRSPRN